MTNENTISLTEALAEHSIPLTTANANRILEGAGLLEGKWRESSKADREPVRYRVATARGLALGIVNEDNAVRRADSVIVKYMPSKFGELWQHPHVVATLRVMLHEGEISMKTTAHAEEF